MNEIKLKGKVILVQDAVTGTSTSGKEWKRQTIVIETEGEYPRKQAIDFFNKDHVPDVGQMVEVDVNISSREFNDRWYTGINCWKWKVDEMPTKRIEQTFSDPAADHFEGKEKKDGLPF